MTVLEKRKNVILRFLPAVGMTPSLLFLILPQYYPATIVIPRVYKLIQIKKE